MISFGKTSMTLLGLNYAPTILAIAVQGDGADDTNAANPMLRRRSSAGKMTGIDVAGGENIDAATGEVVQQDGYNPIVAGLKYAGVFALGSLATLATVGFSNDNNNGAQVNMPDVAGADMSRRLTAKPQKYMGRDPECNIPYEDEYEQYPNADPAYVAFCSGDYEPFKLPDDQIWWTSSGDVIVGQTVPSPVGVQVVPNYNFAVTNQYAFPYNRIDGDLIIKNDVSAAFDLATHFPWLETITGNLVIQGGDYNQIRFPKLNNIHGDMIIENTRDHGISFSGTIDGDIRITGTGTGSISLYNFENSLTVEDTHAEAITVGGPTTAKQISVQNNANLNELVFGDLTTAESVRISNNGNDGPISATYGGLYLRELSTVHGTLRIDQNNFDTIHLPRLASVDDNLFVTKNEASMIHLKSIQSVGGNMKIVHNSNLQDLCCPSSTFLDDYTYGTSWEQCLELPTNQCCGCPELTVDVGGKMNVQGL